MQGSREAFIQNQIVRWGDAFILRPRVHRVRITMGNTAGMRSDETPLDIPTENPFLLCALGWGSNRLWEGLYTSFRMQTEQVIFIQHFLRLQSFGGANGENGPVAWGPSKLVKTDRFIVQTVRETTVNPAEAYPGNQVDSVIDFAFVGFDMLPKDKDSSEDRQA